MRELEKSETDRTRAEQEIAIIAEIGRLIGSTLNIDEVYERFATEARKLIPFDRIHVNLKNPNGEYFTIAYVSGSDIDTRRPGDNIPLAGSISEALVRTRTGLCFHPVSEEEIVSRFPSASAVTTFRAGMRSIMAVPLISKDEVIGALHFRAKKPNAYTDQDLRLAERIGSQIAGAIANAQLFNELSKTEKSLRESEKRFRTLVEHAADGIAEVEASTGRFIAVNRKLCEMVGRTEKELLATTFMAITHPEDANVHPSLSKRMYGGEFDHYSLEKRYLRKDGGVIWVNITIARLWKPGENPGKSIIIVRDITERRGIEEALRKSEAKFRSIYEESPIGIELYDREGTLLDANRVCLELFGISDVTVIKGFKLFEDPNLNEELKAQLRKCESVRYEIPFDFEKVRKLKLYETTKSGAIYLDLLITPLSDVMNESVIGYLVHIRDITERKRAEQTLQESERRFRAMVEQAAVGVAEMEISTGRFLTVNRRLCEMVGRTKEEMLTTNFQAITHPEDLHLHDEKLALLLSGKIGHYSLEKRYLRKDGEIVWVNITISPLWIPGETLGRNMMVIEDITDRKRAEQEKKSLEERLQRAEKMEAIGALAGGVAHDLNNLLGALIGNAEMLMLDMRKTDPLRGLAEEIMSSGERAAAEVQDLLTLARRGVVLKEPVNLNRIVVEQIKTPEFRKMFSSHPHITIENEYDRDLLNINASAIHIERALTNLISNALRSIPGAGTITIRTENRYLDRPLIGYEEVPKGEYVVLSVSDTGNGILPEYLKHLFEPFYMQKVLKRGGTGLGLSVIWGALKDHDGYVDVISDLCKGTTFALYFPATRGKSVRGEQPPSANTRGMERLSSFFKDRPDRYKKR